MAVNRLYFLKKVYSLDQSVNTFWYKSQFVKCLRRDQDFREIDDM